MALGIRIRIRAGVLAAVALAIPLVSCDAISGLFEPRWDVSEANGDKGAFHFVMNAYDLHIGLPEHVRIERIETRSIKTPGGAVEQQQRERKVRVMLAQCESKSVCNAEPHSSDTREVVVTPRIIGETRLNVEAAVDENEVFRDSIKVKVVP